MSEASLVGNPFALMIAPEVIFAAIEQSDRLSRLNSTICRPLDKPRVERPANEQVAFDEEDDAEDINDIDLFGEDLLIG